VVFVLIIYRKERRVRVNIISRHNHNQHNVFTS